MKAHQDIIDQLPYKNPFLFVGDILSLDDEHISGTYDLKTNEYFYSGHFPGTPITPGVIIIEIMAQIGLVCFGIHLLDQSALKKNIIPVFSSTKVDFTGFARPGDHLLVNSKKIYFRFNKLKCEIECINKTKDQVICRGEFSGMIINRENIAE